MRNIFLLLAALLVPALVHAHICKLASYDETGDIDYTLQGNYVLFTSDETLADKKVDFTKNEDTPFGYYAYTPATGTYAKMSTYTTTKGGSTGWCNKNSEYFYIQSDAVMHPLKDKSPAVMFTAPEDGYYKMEINLYRHNPNSKVENPLYLRTRFVTQDDGKLTCEKDVEMYSQQYGSVKNDGQQGKAPIEMAFFVNMKKGDKISAEVEAYTSNNNGSAGTTFTRFVVAGYVSDGQKIDKQYVDASELDVYDPYDIADLTELKALVGSAKTIVSDNADNIGNEGGQYPQDAYTAFVEAVTKAETYTTSSETYAQSVIDRAVADLQSAMATFKASRNLYAVTLPATINLRIAGTQKRLTQKNAPANKNYHYADFCDYAAIVADTAKLHTQMSEYSWVFNATANEAGGYNLTNDNGTVTVDAYVTTDTSDDTKASSRLLFVKENSEDSLVAVKRMSDGKYWTAKIEWKSPYNRVATADTPQYVFVIDDVTEKEAETYDLTVGQYGAATLVLPYDTEIPEGVKAYVVTSMADGKAVAKEVVSTLPANTPVYVTANQGTYTFKATSETNKADNPTYGLLTGVYEETDVPVNSYILWANDDNAVGFYQVTKEGKGKVAANRAYLTVPSSSESKILVSFDTATGISQTETVANAEGNIYTINGVRVNKPLGKGIYIMNGKKFVVR